MEIYDDNDGYNTTVTMMMVEAHGATMIMMKMRQHEVVDKYFM